MFIEYFKKFSLGKLVRRAFCGLFIVNTIALLTNYSVVFYEKEFFVSQNFVLTLAEIAALFLLFTVADIIMFARFPDFKTDKCECLILLFAFLLYAVTAMSQYRNEWFNLGMLLCLLAVIVCVCTQKGTIKHGSFPDGDDFPREELLIADIELSKKALVAFTICCFLFFSVFVGMQGVFRVLTQSTPNFDFGIFSQMFYYMKKTFQPLTTTERDVLLSHFAIHVSPIYYLFLPFYMLFPDPITLEICQAVTIASGVIPVYLIAKKIGLSNKASAAFVFLYTLYPTFTGGCYYDLHENKFLAPLIMWLFYFIEKDKLAGTLVFSLLVCLVKEDAAVYIIFIALYVILSGKSVKKGLSMLVMGFAYFFGVITYLEHYGYAGVMSNRYDNFIYEEDGGLFTVIKSIILSPANVIKECFEKTAPEGDYSSKTEFILQMLAPLGFLPVITKKWARYILLCPFILVNLMPDYQYQHSINFQYTYATGAILVYLAMLNYRDFTPKMKRIGLTFAVCSSFLLYVQYIFYRGNYLVNYVTSREKHVEVRQALLDIPEEASVSASTFYVTTCSQREIIYDLDHYAKRDQLSITTDYIALDLRYKRNRDTYALKYESNEDYELVTYIDGWLALLKYTGE